MADDFTLQDALNHPSWEINDSLRTLRFHADRLLAHKAITLAVHTEILRQLPAERITPDLDAP